MRLRWAKTIAYRISGETPRGAVRKDTMSIDYNPTTGNEAAARKVISNGVYIAAKFERRVDLRENVKQLTDLGYVCTSEWINTPTDQFYVSNDEQMDQDARMDLEHVRRAQYFICLIDDLSGRGGMHVEYGYALALGKICIIVGPIANRNLFHWLKTSISVATWEDALKLLRR